MSTVEKEVKLIFSDVNDNKNKFWHGYLYSNGDVKVEWGRVGYGTQTKVHHSAGERKLNALERSKLAKGYSPQQTISGSSASKSPSLAKDGLKEKAKQDIKGCPEVKKLVEWLADVNIHNITANTKITYDINEGVFKTPLGLVTVSAIQEARGILDEMSNFVIKRDWEANKYKDLLNNYCRIIPQNVGMKRGWHERLFQDGQNDLIKQNDILDSLDASLVSVKNVSSTKTGAKVDVEEKVWNVSLELVKDDAVVNRVRNKYTKSKGNHWDVKDLDVKRVFTLEMPSLKTAFLKDGKKVGGIRQLWHGTKASNLLSILKVGLVIPPSNSGHCTGRMFGNGVYFSDQSTKAIRYATGAWAGGGNTNRTFMFLGDVAMGKPYTPNSYGSNMTPPKGYDSVFAKAGYSGVQNNEMIVYRLSQIDLVYLVEFTKYGK